jgi:cell division protease FtsH
LIVLLGGRAAEMNVFGEPSTRAEDDLAHAAALARRMVERWAMTGRFELAGRSQTAVVPAIETSGDVEVRDLLARAEQAARMILDDHTNRLRAVAEILSERESLTIADVAELTGLWGWRHGDGLEPAAGPERLRALNHG